MLWEHSSDGLSDHVGWASLVEAASLWVCVDSLSEIEVPLGHSHLEGSADLEIFTSDKNDFLAEKEVLGNNGGYSAENVTVTINNNNAHFFCFCVLVILFLDGLRFNCGLSQKCFCLGDGILELVWCVWFFFWSFGFCVIILGKLGGSEGEYCWNEEK